MDGVEQPQAVLKIPARKKGTNGGFASLGEGAVHRALGYGFAGREQVELAASLGTQMSAHVTAATSHTPNARADAASGDTRFNEGSSSSLYLYRRFCCSLRLFYSNNANSISPSRFASPTMSTCVILPPAIVNCSTRCKRPPGAITKPTRPSTNIASVP